MSLLQQKTGRHWRFHRGAIDEWVRVGTFTEDFALRPEMERKQMRNFRLDRILEMKEV